MEMNLAENIRKFRKERALTQEQLAEVLGVTVGAVYKWEAKLSIPDIMLILEMADFFDTSVDVLLGYEMKDNRLETSLKRMKDYRHNKDDQGLSEAEKALKKYPHSFEIVHESANMYRLFGIERKNKEYLRRALELQEETVILLPQNIDPEVGEISLYGEMAEIYLALEETDQGLEILKGHNANGIYDDLIGLALSNERGREEEAVPYLSKAFLQSVSSLIQATSGLANVYDSREDYVSAEALMNWKVQLLSGLRREGKVGFLQKVNSVFMLSLAYFQLKNGKEEEARQTLCEARTLAEEFDVAPDYSAAAVRFVEKLDKASASDDMGATAMESLENAVKVLNDDKLNELWRSL